MSARTQGRGAAVRAAALPLFLLPVLAACQTAGPVGRIVTPSKVEPSDPLLNPKPGHVVRLYGRAPETLDFRFRVAFVATNPEGDCWNHAGFWEGGGGKTFAYDIYPVRKGDTWEADLVVDRYLPGRCGWNVRGNAMIMVEPLDARAGDTFMECMRLVVGDARDRDDNAPRCQLGNPRCSEERSRRLSNSDDTIPVEVRCKRVKPVQRAPRSTVFICNEFPEYKTTHLLQKSTRRVRIDLYDLDHDQRQD